MKRLLILTLAALPALAQTAPEYTVTIVRSGNTVAVDTQESNITERIVGDDPTLTVWCAPPVNCTTLHVTQGSTVIDATTSTARKATYAFSPFTGTTTLALKTKNGETLNAVRDGRFEITRDATADPQPDEPEQPDVDADTPDEEPPAEDASLQEILSNPCAQLRRSAIGAYDREKNYAIITVTPTGAKVAAPFEEIDTNDTVEIRVIGDVRLGAIDVRRISPRVTLGQFPVVGEDAIGAIDLRSAVAHPCTTYVFYERLFAPPTGVAEILRADGSRLGTFNVDVNPLYRGMFTLGVIKTDLIDRTYTLAPKGEKQIILQENLGEDELNYALFFTPFWKARDIEREKIAPLQRFNLSFGIVPDNVADHALAGISFDAAGIVVTWGYHFANTATLHPSSGLTVGGEFTGTAAEIPTATEWESETFWGISLDLRVAVNMLRNLLTTPGS